MNQQVSGGVNSGMIVIGGIVTLIAIAGFIFSFRGLMAALPEEPTPTAPQTPRVNPTVPAATHTSIPTDSAATADVLWAQTFILMFPAGFWESGSHSYQSAFNCVSTSGNVLQADWEQGFTVSIGAPMYAVPIYLGPSGPVIGPDGGTILEEIHPDQTTIGVVSLEDYAYMQAGFIQGDCSATFGWDDGPLNEMTPMN
jgi:hypothetical protein